jgi:predicted transcriptional regulator
VKSRRHRGRGGKGGHEPQARIREREQLVVELATLGRTQEEIAHELDVSQPAVSKILRRVDDQWVRENVDRIAHHKAQQVRKLERLFREAMRAWDQSKAQRTRRRQRKTGTTDGDLGETVAEITVDDSYGDPRYLEAARRSLNDLARVWGVHKTTAADEIDDADVVFTLDVTGSRTKHHKNE